MAVDFTAVYEPQPNGSIVAYLAELPAVTTGGRNLEEARARLAEQLRLFLEHERAEVLARAATGAQIEPLRVDGEAERRHSPRNGQAKPARGRRKHRRAEPGLLEQLQKLGWIDRLPAPDLLDDNFQPVRLPGEPLSQQIIRERR